MDPFEVRPFDKMLGKLAKCPSVPHRQMISTYFSNGFRGIPMWDSG